MIVEGIFDIISTAISFVLQWWWVVAPIILFLIFKDLWLKWRRAGFGKKIKWTLLHLVVPQEVLKTPLAMEQVFANLHSIQHDNSWWEKNIEGRFQETFSLEIISASGDIHLFVRTPTQFRNLVESAIYAQYPGAEIAEVEDYTQALPDNLPSEELNIFGSRFALINDDPYPIRTYDEFEFETREGVGDVDPIAHLSESLGRVKNGEQLWLQIIIAPAGDSWKKDGEEILEELMGRSKEKSGGGPSMLGMISHEVAEYARTLPEAPFRPPVYLEGSEGTSKEEKQESRFLAEHENERAKAVAHKLSKVGFNTTIRGVFIAQKEIFDQQGYFSVVSAFRQFTNQNLNGLKPTAITSGRWPLKKGRILAAKRAHYSDYRKRKTKEGFILNTEELATIFHFPGRVVSTPTLPRVESRKGEPPAGLPML